MRPLIRVGAVNYLNSKPLIEGLAEYTNDIHLELDIPSRLADRMACGELDVGQIPVVEFFRAGNYSYVPNIGVSSRGPVLSVTLFSKVRWQDIRSVSLDEGSRTSAALTRILLAKRHNVRPLLRQLPMDAAAESVTTDAVLLIGDRAMKACLPGFDYAYDLGQEWTDWTGLPMVFAVWAVREGVDLGRAERALVQAKEMGLRHAGAIAAREAGPLGLDPGFCRRYLTNIIHYDLGPRELAGLNHYYELAAELGLAPKGVNLVHYHRPNLVQSY